MEPGYYKVRNTASVQWEPALYDGYNWWFIANETPKSHLHVLSAYIIGPRIEPPEEGEG